MAVVITSFVLPLALIPLFWVMRRTNGLPNRILGQAVLFIILG